jgi:Fur family ferric uptake transcriptional regulator
LRCSYDGNERLPVDDSIGSAYKIRAILFQALRNSARRTMPLNRPQTDPSRIEARCSEQGLRMTGQRRTIARVLSESRDHPDVEEVHRRVHAIDTRISLSTVYRTLRLFSQLGILERHDFGRGRRQYEEASRQHHDHLVDVETGRVIEFSNDEIEALQERIALELGFKLVGHRLELYGVSNQKKKKPARRSGGD